MKLCFSSIVRDGALANAARVLSWYNLSVFVTATYEQLLTVDIVTTFESFENGFKRYLSLKMIFFILEAQHLKTFTV